MPPSTIRPLPFAGATSRRFEGKLALVTGANLGGIGGAIATRLAVEGANLALLSRDSLEPLLETLAPYADRIASLQGDVRKDADVRAFVEMAVRRFGPIHVLVNNAGIEAVGPFEQLSECQWIEVLEVNLCGVIRVTRAVLPELTGGRSCIVNIASALALAGSQGFAAYSASKGGVVALTRSLAAEWASRGVRVVAVAPALVKTPLMARHVDQSQENVARLKAAQPLGIGKPEDVAAAVAFLASDEARWITGAVLPLGWLPALDLPMGQRELTNQRRAA